ncbi:MAG: anthranilate synthase component I [Syntrophales bacterium]|nr:anthranilate synthase component I [Syntrophales bacterium]
MYHPDRKTFKELAKQGTLVPVFREIIADTETPVSLLLKIARERQVFLLESVEGGEKWGRYTFLGSKPKKIIRIQKENGIVENAQGVSVIPHDGKPLDFLRREILSSKPVKTPGLPRFFGGAVGFFSYDMVRYFEHLPDNTLNDLPTDEAVFLLTDTLFIFDNIRHTVKVLACAHIDEKTDLDTLYDETVDRIEQEISLLNPCEFPTFEASPEEKEIRYSSNLSPEAFKDIVRRAKEYIFAGDIIQVVLSQRFEIHENVSPVDLYRALRFINPSPYLFFLKIDDLHLIGSSPEVLVRMEEGLAEVKPIAGTKKRGRTEQEDRKLADELLQDPKERAEHVMLVDLGRNDLGRIARKGSVQVNQFMTVERYSHVMHLVSLVQAQVAPDKDCFDVLASCFPAGTLTGAPKIRAMEIIDELEPTRRNIYGGAVGYFSYTGNMDFCITIRTLVKQRGRLFLQAGAGIVADSDPQSEYEETLNKAQGMMQAVRLVKAGFKI